MGPGADCIAIPTCGGRNGLAASQTQPGRTQVHFTVDVECSVGGAFNGPDRYPRGFDLRVWGRLANQPRPWGIEFIMDELEGHGFVGTFFIEAFSAQFFGINELKRVCAEVLSRGHDIQLHLHPGMLNLTPGAERQFNNLSDEFHNYDLDSQVELLRRGLDTLVECGVPAPVAFRAGSFAANTDTWTALRRVGLRISSNYNLNYIADQSGLPAYCSRRPERCPWRRVCSTCRLPAEMVRNDLFRVPETENGTPGRDTIFELPITNIRTPRFDGRLGYRHLAIPALSTAEMIRALRGARRIGVRHITLIMHSFDFVWLDCARDRAGRPIIEHIARFRRLCDWLADHPDEFQVSTVQEVAAQVSATSGAGHANSVCQNNHAVPRGSLLLGSLRQAQQVHMRMRYR